MECFYESLGGSSDELRDLWDTDLDPTMNDVLRLHSSNDMSIDWGQHDKDNIPCVIIHDRLMTDAAFCHNTATATTTIKTVRPIKTEHSYSLSSDGGSLPDSPRSFKKDDMEDECFPAISMKKACRKFNEIDDDLDDVKIEIKDEPMSETDSINSSCPSSPLNILTSGGGGGGCFNVELPQHQFLRHSSGLILSSAQKLQNNNSMPKLSIKIESGNNSNFQLPPTPPSCSSSSGDDSEDNVAISPSPSSNSTTGSSTNNNRKSTLVSTARLLLNHHTNTRQPIHTHLISSQPKGSTGTLILTEEEKRTLIAEGYPVPTRLPLSKAEEKSLKKIRRKIKNKISAQESRRKKKEYMDQLERKVGLLVHENNEYRKKIDDLQDSNKNLLTQMQKLQAIVAKTHPNVAKQLEKF